MYNLLREAGRPTSSTLWGRASLLRYEIWTDMGRHPLNLREKEEQLSIELLSTRYYGCSATPLLLVLWDVPTKCTLE